LVAAASSAHADQLSATIRASVAVGWQVALIVGTVLLVVGAIGTWFALPRDAGRSIDRRSIDHGAADAVAAETA
jgi:hypothetical protein